MNLGASQTDFFPDEFGAAQAAHEPPCHPDSRCSVCYSPEFIADAESFDSTYDDAKDESEDRYWFWDDDAYSLEVCVPRWGPL